MNFSEIRILSVYKGKIVYKKLGIERTFEDKLPNYKGRKLFCNDRLYTSKVNQEIKEYFNLTEFQRNPNSISHELYSIRNPEFKNWILEKLIKENITEVHKKKLREVRLKPQSLLEEFGAGTGI